jgi:hypothetical protein
MADNDGALCSIKRQTPFLTRPFEAVDDPQPMCKNQKRDAERNFSLTPKVRLLLGVLLLLTGHGHGRVLL